MKKEDLLQYLKSIPKADLHNHLTLGISRQKLNRYFPESNLVFPTEYRGLPGMIDFINNKINPIMNNQYALELFILGGIEAAIEDNVKILEASIDITLCKFYGGSAELFCNMIRSLTTKYAGIFFPILGINKKIGTEELDTLYSKCIDSGVFYGIDLYGVELSQDISRFVPQFDYAEQKGLLKKVHIGEFSDCNTIETAINLFNPDEIEHGIRAVDSEQTMAMILERDITLNICPESNRQLGATTDIFNHPIKKLFDFGIDVTVNTDDLLLFNKSISEQFTQLIDSNIFSLEEAEQILRNGLRKKT
ncbi:MAG: hypothetical protein OCD02_00795 [Spirochaetaceae bacterium]